MAVKPKATDATKVVDPLENQNQSNEPKENTNPETGKGDGENPKESSKENSGNEALEAKAGMTYEKAKIEMSNGSGIKLPEWGGLWFQEVGDDDTVFVLTKEGEFLDTPNEEYKERNDWQIAELTDDQAVLMENFWNKRKSDKLAKENEKLLSIKVVKFNRSYDGQFHKLKEKITYSDVLERKNIPADAVELLFEDGKIFNVPEFQLTNKTI